jgi:hypothetical protein
MTSSYDRTNSMTTPIPFDQLAPAKIPGVHVEPRDGDAALLDRLVGVVTEDARKLVAHALRVRDQNAAQVDALREQNAALSADLARAESMIAALEAEIAARSAAE